MTIEALGAAAGAGPSLAQTSPGAGSATNAQAYAEALQFETLLVSQLTQQLASSAGLDGQGSDSSGAGGGDSSSDSAGQMLGAFVPQALTSAIMSGGGLGIAASLAPGLESAPASSAGGRS